MHLLAASVFHTHHPLAELLPFPLFSAVFFPRELLGLDLIFQQPVSAHVYLGY